MSMGDLHYQNLLCWIGHECINNVDAECQGHHQGVQISSKYLPEGHVYKNNKGDEKLRCNFFGE